MENFFIIYTRSDLSRIGKETIKKRLVWSTGEFKREHVAVNSRYVCQIFTVFSNMANRSFNFFVSFSISEWKEIVESLNNFPFWEETRSFICFFQLTVNEKVFLSLLANAVNSGYDRGGRCLSAVFFAMLTCWHVQFSKIFAFLFFSIFLDKIGLGRKSRDHKTVTNRPLFPL